MADNPLRTIPGADRPAASGIKNLSIPGVVRIGDNGNTMPAPSNPTPAPAPSVGNPPIPSGRR